MKKLDLELNKQSLFIKYLESQLDTSTSNELLKTILTDCIKSNSVIAYNKIKTLYSNLNKLLNMEPLVDFNIDFSIVTNKTCTDGVYPNTPYIEKKENKVFILNPYKPKVNKFYTYLVSIDQVNYNIQKEFTPPFFITAGGVLNGKVVTNYIHNSQITKSERNKEVLCNVVFIPEDHIIFKKYGLKKIYTIDCKSPILNNEDYIPVIKEDEELKGSINLRRQS